MPRRQPAYPASIRDRLVLAWLKRLHLRKFPPSLWPAIDLLCMLRRPTVRLSATAFEAVGTRRTHDELTRLASALSMNHPVKIRNAIALLHQPAIVALAKIGLLRSALASDARPAQAAKHVADLAAKIAVPNPAGGRPQHKHAQVITRVVVAHYELVRQDMVRQDSDMLPDREYTLVRLVGNVLRILRVTADPRSAVRAALARHDKMVSIRRKPRIKAF